MAEIKRFIMLCVLLLGSLTIGLAAAGNLPSFSSPQTYTVPDLLADRPLDTEVVVTDTVTAIEDDHVTDSGNTYQQFRIGSADADVLVFCSTYDGRVDVDVGDVVTVPGTFQEFYGTDEIAGDCADIAPAE